MLKQKNKKDAFKEPLVEVKDFSISFPTLEGVISPVKNINFSIFPGEAVGLIGESGCGKSLLSKSLIKLTPKRAKTKGSILYNKKDIFSIPQKQLEKIREKEIGFVFQDPMTSLNPTMQIGKQILESLKTNKEEVIKLLYSVGIVNPELKFSQYPHECSGGIRQRILIAIAIASSPKLIIADEPTTALDVTVQAKILDLLKELQLKEKMGMLLISHDLSIIAGTCDRVLIMYAGNIVEEGPVDDIFYKPQHPYTKALLNAIPQLGKKDALVPIKGSPPHFLELPKGCPFSPRCPFKIDKCLQNPQLTKVMPEHKVACWLYPDLKTK